MVKSIDDGVTNPNSKEYLEEDVRRVFSSGQAAFALNWTYMYNLANDPKESKIAGKVGMVPAPGIAGKLEASAVNGSMGLGITAASKHPDEAWKYILAMTSQETQDKYAQLSLPIWSAWYEKPGGGDGPGEPDRRGQGRAGRDVSAADHAEIPGAVDGHRSRRSSRRCSKSAEPEAALKERRRLRPVVSGL